MTQRDFHINRMNAYLRGRLAEETYQESYRKKFTFRPSLTLSRQCGARADELGRMLIEYLEAVDETATHGWALFDQSLIGRVIEDHVLPDTVSPYHAANAKFPGGLGLEKVLSLDPSKWTLFNYSAKTIRSLCTLGNTIILGRAGNFVTSDLDNTFHVRLVGSFDDRVQSVATRHLLSRENAEMLVRETDFSRARFVKRYTRSDIDDPNAYHLVINSDDLSDEAIVRILSDSVLEWAHDREKRLHRAESLPNTN
ncbi:MAG: cytidylate kinase-like family protein [Verrucomicrobiota bacterium]